MLGRLSLVSRLISHGTLFLRTVINTPSHRARVIKNAHSAHTNSFASHSGSESTLVTQYVCAMFRLKARKRYCISHCVRRLVNYSFSKFCMKYRALNGYGLLKITHRSRYTLPFCNISFVLITLLSNRMIDSLFRSSPSDEKGGMRIQLPFHAACGRRHQSNDVVFPRRFRQ